MKISKCNDIISPKDYFSFLPLCPFTDPIASALIKEIVQILKEDCGQRGNIYIYIYIYIITQQLENFTFSSSSTS
jgi:hypothetical protein